MLFSVCVFTVTVYFFGFAHAHAQRLVCFTMFTEKAGEWLVFAWCQDITSSLILDMESQSEIPYSRLTPAIPFAESCEDTRRNRKR
jgi:hypothetical protein